MKAIKLILLSLYATLTFGQSSEDAMRKLHSEKNVEFALANEGKKIGKGVCFEFVFESIKRYHPNTCYYIFEHRDPFQLKGYSEVIPGDIVVFRDVVYGNDTIVAHIGIIMQVEPDGFYYANQNVVRKGDKVKKVISSIDESEHPTIENSKVEISTFVFGAMRSGNVMYYRF